MLGFRSTVTASSCKTLVDIVQPVVCFRGEGRRGFNNIKHPIRNVDPASRG